MCEVGAGDRGLSQAQEVLGSCLRVWGCYEKSERRARKYGARGVFVSS